MKNLLSNIIVFTTLIFLSLTRTVAQKDSTLNLDNGLDNLSFNELMSVDYIKKCLPIEADSATLSKENTINLGLIVPMSKYKDYSLELYNAAMLAAEEVNKGGKILGKDIYIILADDGGEKSFAVQKAAILKSKFNVAAIIGPTSSSRFIATAEKVTIPQKIILFGTDVTAEKITDLKDENLVWRTSMVDSYQGKIVSDLILQMLKLKKAGIIYSGNTFGKNQLQFFTKNFIQQGGQIVSKLEYSDLVDYSTFDLKPNLKEFFLQKPEVIYFISNPTDGALITKQIAEGNFIEPTYKPYFVSCGSNKDTMFLAGGASSILNGMYGVGYFPDTGMIFKENYKKKYGTYPVNSTSAGVYDAIMLLSFAMLEANSNLPVEIAKYLQKVSTVGQKVSVGQFATGKSKIENKIDIDYDGASGKIDFDENGDPTSGLYEIWKIDNNRFTTYKIIPIGR